MKKEKRAQKAWTTLEERYLKQNAGFLCISEIALRLDRSEASVKSKASRLRKQNGCLSLRHFKSKLVWCPRCATLRTKLFSKTGHCMVCRLRDRHSRIVDDCETALLSLGEEHRFYYEVYEGYRQSSLPKRPVSTSIKGLDTYDRLKEQERHTVELEDWEASCIQKRIKADKMRLSRIREKIRGAGG